MSNFPFTKRMGSHVGFVGFAIDLLNHWCIYSIYIFFNSLKLLASRLSSMWLPLKMAEQLEWYVLFESFSIEFPGLKMWKPKRNIFFFTLSQSGLCGDISELCIGLFGGMGAFNTKFDKRFGGIPAFLQEEGHYLGAEGRVLQTVTQLHGVPELPSAELFCPEVSSWILGPAQMPQFRFHCGGLCSSPKPFSIKDWKLVTDAWKERGRGIYT